MYLYQPCLLTLALLNWAQGWEGRFKRIALTLAPVLVLAVSEWETQIGYVSVYPAGLLLPITLLSRKTDWPEAITASMLAGLLCWKAADLWPLLAGRELLWTGLMLVPVHLLVRRKEDRFFACALGGLFFELCFCIREYMLFSFCVVRFGSREGLSLAALSICCSVLLQGCIWLALRRRKNIDLIRI